MAAGKNDGIAPGGSKLTTVLVPVVGVALIVVLVVVVAAMSDSPSKSTEKDKGGTTGGPVSTDKLTDGSDPTAADAGLKDIGGGLQIRDLKEGTGPVCPPGGTVVAHYTGWLKNGKVFDSSRRKGKPIEFSLNGVVKGWQEGIPGMKVGGIRKLVIPPDMGYGARGQGDIPPNSVLIFEVEIVEMK